MGIHNPALAAFQHLLQHELVLAEVLIQPLGNGWILRHRRDRERSQTPTVTSDSTSGMVIEGTGLKDVPYEGLQDLVQLTAQGVFRPLRTAPNLKTGWKHFCASAEALDAALNILYPGAVADWHAVESKTASATDFRAFVDRQTGMYRIAGLLQDAPAEAMICATCAPAFCLKRRLWTVASLPRETASPEKSLIPCLEPCAVLLEFARKAMRIEQEDPITLIVRPSDLETIRSTLTARPLQSGDTREADFSNPTNPRRIQLVIEKLRKLIPGEKPEEIH